MGTRMADWFGVRCVFHDPEGTFEERVTIWWADVFEEAVLMAEAELRSSAPRPASTHRVRG